MFAAELVITIVATFIGPSLNTSSVLQIILPFSFIHCAIDMFIDTRAICFIVCPETIVNVSINMDELAFSMSTILPPLANVLCSIRPCLLSKTVAEASFPLTCVDCSSFELVRRPLFSWLIWFVKTFRDSLARFFLSEVF